MTCGEIRQSRKTEEVSMDRTVKTGGDLVGQGSMMFGR